MKFDFSRKTPLALGIHWAHDASVAICTPDECLFSVAEERLTRVKHYYGFPIEGIKLGLQYLGIDGKDIDVVAISTQKPLFPQHKNYISVGIDGSISGEPFKKKWIWPLRFLKGETCVSTSPRTLSSFKGTAWEGFEHRHWSYHQKALGELGLLRNDIHYVYVAHHRAHAAGAFRMSGMHGEKVCVVTMDGKGDGFSGAIFLGTEEGELKLQRSTKAHDSLGSFYQAVTEALGFVPVDGEYKTMGLAAFGRKDLPNPFKYIVGVNDGVTKSQIKWSFRSYNNVYPAQKVPNPLSSVSETEHFRKYLDQFEPAQIAYFAQDVLEDNLLAMVADAVRITGSNKLAVAGGVMLNVKANGRIRNSLTPEKHFVFPDSADSGLALGAAMEALHVCGYPSRACLSSMYLGPDFSNEQLAKDLAGYENLDIKQCGNSLPVHVAKKLAEGKVIGTFQGRLEMGPRALGNRSVLADPRDPKVKDRINLILKGREWFVPFAPIVLEDEACIYWEGPIDYRHMTFSVKASSKAKELVPGVVHIDGTMRPQVVSKKTNAWIHDVLVAFRQYSGVGVLINTSFNRHGLPIVGAPADAVYHLREGWIDGLAIGDYYVTRRGEN